MKIIQAELTRFGKFKNEVITPVTGVWRWTRPNESGKTTFADFIRFVLYGFPKSRAKQEISGDKLKKYLPWGETTMAGALTVETSDGKRYRIERTSDEKGKGSVTVLDEMGRETGITAPGETLLGVDGETFCNIFYLSQSDPVPHRTEQMEVAMKNLVTTGEESVSFDAVLEKLTKKQSQYMSQKRDTGKLKSKKERRRQLMDDIRQTEMLTASLSELPDETELAADIERQAAVLAAFAAYEKQQAEQQKKQRNDRRAALRQTVQTAEARLSADKALSKEQISALGAAFDEIERHTTLAAAAKAQASALPPVSELTDTEQKLLSLPPQKAVSKAPLWMVTAAVAVLGGIGCFVLLPAGLALLGAAVILAVITLTRKSVPSAVAALGFSDIAAMESAKAVAGEHAARIAAQTEQQAALCSAVRTAERELAACKEKHRALIEQSGIADRTALTAAIGAAAEKNAVKERLAEAYAELDALGEDEPVTETGKVAVCPDGTADKARQKLAALYDRKASLSVETERKNKLLQTLSDQKEQLSELCDDIAKDEAEYEVLCIAVDTLREAGERLQHNYAPILRKSLTDKIRRITAGKYDTVTVDADLNIRLYADGGMRQLGYFSDGTRDAVYLALRLTMADIVERNEKLPFIFDDAFSSLDESRLAGVQGCLSALDDRQIIILQCR